jgi:GAF domain-containing protein
MAKLADSVSAGEFNEEFRITRPDGSARWLWSRAFLVRSPGRTNGWLIGTALDVTTRKQAEIQIAAHLCAAETARSEAEALRRATLALTQNLAMDSILDTLLACLADVVPYRSASVLFAETNEQFLIAREAPRRGRKTGPVVIDVRNHPLFQKILVEKRSILIPDSKHDRLWTKPQIPDDTRCWMGIPLVASEQMLGILSVAAATPNAFTPEHLRLAKSLAIPAAVGIQNARIHERAAIYASELEVQLRHLEQAREALARNQKGPGPKPGPLAAMG